MAPANANEVFKFKCTIKKETEKALLVTIVNGEDEPENIWFPLSQVTAMSHTKAVMGYDEVTVKMWIAKNKGLV
jgi:hypothetical protein